MSPVRSFTRAARSRTMRTAAVACVAAAVGAGSVVALDSGNNAGPTQTASPTAIATPASNRVSLTAAQTDFGDIYKNRAAGVVSILAGTGSASSQAAPGDGSPFSPAQPQQEPSTAQGSGVVIDSDGHILTNEHVVSGATTLRVTFSSGSTVDAKVVGTDPSTDLALLKVDVPSSELTVVPLGDSSSVAIGDPVLAIGSPFGYQGTATAGIISGLGRSIQSPNGFSVPDAIQTDAAINHGNSGGALLDDQGALIGVPAQIADSGVNANVGVAFAIPVNTAKRVIASLRSGDSVNHAWLGVSTATVGPALEGVEGIGASAGALVTGVAQGSPAAKAGLNYGNTKASSLAGPVCTGGDIITTVGGTPVANAEELQTAVDAQAPGATVDMTVVNADGNTRTVSVTLAERPQAAPQTAVGCGG